MSRVTHVDSRRFTGTDLSMDERAFILAAELGGNPESKCFD
jgi:hypothetical protein